MFNFALIAELRFGPGSHALIAESRFGPVNHALIAESRFGPMYFWFEFFEDVI